MQPKIAIGLVILGILLGGGGGWLIKPQPVASPTRTPVSSIPEGWQEVSLPFDDAYVLTLQIRITDKIARLKEGDQMIGFKVFDQYAPTTAVDIVTKRLEQYYDLPAATSLGEYKENRDGFSVQQTREATIHGQAALKQLYTATIGQKRADGAILKRPQSNLMRYVIEGPEDRFVIMKASAAHQTYLDTIALSLRVVPASQATETDRVELDIQEDEPTDLQPTNGDGVDLFQGSSGINL
ncbi:hypothetical protein HY523_02235 [Candidatus Berkelbacteria bacterium]|nr:hypothetical protein [Candidatus Berkelbacteria bacterium]